MEISKRSGMKMLTMKITISERISWVALNPQEGTKKK